MTEIKTVLLIGRSGRGKSTLANVVTDTNNFKESSSSVSETKKVQFEKFADEEYAIIDTPGIGDTKMSDNEVLDIIAEAVYLAKDGISQVFFVVNGRFDQYEMATYDLLRTILFDGNITKHTTIVRTKFKDFEKLDKCQTDISDMIEEAKEMKARLEQNIATKKSEKKKKFYLRVTNSNQYEKLSNEIKQLKKEFRSTNLAEILDSCQGKIVYADNPSLRIIAPDNEDDEGRKLREAEINLNKNKRAESRKILLKHLSKNCQASSYKPEKLKELSEEIAGDYFQYLQKKAELQKELDEEMKRLNFKAKASVDFQSVSDQTSNVNIPIKDNQTELTLEEKAKPTETEKDVVIIEKEKLEKIIAELQSKKEKLQKEIAEKEKIIHQKVLKHIFNNYQEIKQELGGDIFLNSVAGDHDWQEIHSKFSDKELVIKWLSQGFSYQQTKDWATALGDFSPKIDADFCAWLRDKKKLSVEIVKRASYPQNIERWRKEYAVYLEKEIGILGKHSGHLKKDWTDIHPDFAKYKSNWESDGLTYQDAKEWIAVFELAEDDCCKVKSWKAKGFDFNQAKNWIDAGLNKDSYEFAYHLKKDNYQPTDLNSDNLEQLRKKYSWQDIHEDFSFKQREKWEEQGLFYQEAKTLIDSGFLPKDYDKAKKWKEKGFDYNKVKEWIDAGLNKDEHKFANYLKQKNYEPNNPNIQEIIQKESWKDIHPDFKYSIRKTWEEAKFTHSETQEWISAGFEPGDYDKVKEWKNHNFTSQEAKSWIDIGLEDAEFATHLKQNNYTPNTAFQEKSYAQTWLDWKYPKKQRKKITNLSISSKNLQGFLDLSDFVSLKELDCQDDKLTSLNLSNCSSLDYLVCTGNKLTEIALFEDGRNLKKLWIRNNNLHQDLTFLKGAVNLEGLYLGNDSREITQGIYNKLYGSLEPLKNMSKLKTLNISDTDIDSGLEYLPDSLETFEYSTDKRKDAKVKTIYNLLQNIEGENFPQKLQAYKQKLQEQSQQTSQILQPNLPKK